MEVAAESLATHSSIDVQTDVYFGSIEEGLALRTLTSL